MDTSYRTTSSRTPFTDVGSFHLQIVLMLALVLGLWSHGIAKAPFFNPSTFDQFIYPGARLDSIYSKMLLTRIRDRFPEARAIKVKSLLTGDQPAKVILHYTRMTGQPFNHSGGRYIRSFATKDGYPLSRIDISSVPIPHLSESFWPTRIDLVLTILPIDHEDWTCKVLSKQELKSKAGRLLYDGKVFKDITLNEQVDLGSRARVLVIGTKDPFYNVLLFFRRRIRRRIRVIPAREGDLYVRDFEVDATASAGLDRSREELHIRVEENPLVIDQNGNSQNYLGWVFIKYILWNNKTGT